MLVEGDTLVGAVQKLCQGSLTLLDPDAPQVLAIMLEEVERAEDGGLVMTPVAQKVERCEAALVDHNDFAVDEARPRWQARDGLDDLGEAVSEIVSVACV